MNTVPPGEIAAIALGSNQGNSKEILQGAIADLTRIGEVLRVSPWYQTPPIGPVQPDYINGCLLLHYPGDPLDLMRSLLDIEGQYGRIRTIRWGPRTLDLDLLFRGADCLNSEYLTLPHPRMHERGFVLAPLANIYPDWIHPIHQKSIAQLLTQVSCSDITRLDN